MDNSYSLRKLAIDGTVNGGHNMHTNTRRKWALSTCSVLIRAHWRLMKDAPNVAIFLCPERIKDRDKVTHRYIRPIRFFLLKKNLYSHYESFLTMILTMALCGRDRKDR